MIFKRKISVPTLINIYDNDRNPFVLELNTTLASQIYCIDNKYYIDVKINDTFKTMFNRIINDCEFFLDKEKLCKTFSNKCIISDDNILKIKILRKYNKYQLKINSDKLLTSFDLISGLNAKLLLHLEYIWMSDLYWGLTWKTNEISIINNHL